MEMENDAIEFVKELMNLVKELFQKYVEELSLRMKKCLKDRYMKKVTKNIPMKFLMLKIQTRHLMKAFRLLFILHIKEKTR